MNIKGIIEAILFFSSDPVEISSIAKLLKIEEELVEREVFSLQKNKYNEDSGIKLKRIKNMIFLATDAIHYDIIKDFFKLDESKDLTKSALEVLAIIAYKQPVTKIEIEKIRGVKSDHMLSRLIDEGFIYVSDTLDAPGRPNLYSTTNDFLIKFNIKGLDELPERDIKVEEGNGDKQ